MRKPTYSQLESSVHESQNLAGIQHCAINDLLNDRQTWFRAGKVRVGTSRETGPEGGLVIHRQLHDDGTSYSCVYLWEDWFPKVRDSIPAINDKEAMDLRNCALQAHEHVLRMQSEQNPLPVV